MGIKITSSGNLERKLKDLAERARQLDGSHEVPITELLTPTFLAACSRFSSFQEMLQASGFSVNSAEDFRAIPDEEWDAFVASNTSYPDWKSLRVAAGREWTKGKLGL